MSDLFCIEEADGSFSGPYSRLRTKDDAVRAPYRIERPAVDNPATEKAAFDHRALEDGVVVDRYVVCDLTQDEKQAYQDGLAENKKEQRQAAIKALTSLHYDKETAGIAVDGMPVRTDRDSQAKLFAASTMAKKDADAVLNWKTSQGDVSLDAPRIILIADAVAAYIWACGICEASLLGKLKAAQDPGRVDITAGWPPRENNA